MHIIIRFRVMFGSLPIFPMTQPTLLVDLDPLSQRMMKILLESVNCQVHILDDTQELPGLLKEVAFESIVVSTLGSISDPLLIAEQAKRAQPSSHVLLWGPRSITLRPADSPYVDEQLLMPCTLAQLGSALRARRDSTLPN